MKKLIVKNQSLFTEDGIPFFYTACTAWELFHKLTFEEAKYYLNNRAKKGFNVIQAVVIAELDGLKTPDYETGNIPFDDLTIKEPNNEYFSHVKNVMEYANSIGLYIALVPMWGSYLVANEEWGTTKPVFDIESSSLFIDYLANLLSDCDVIWMLGGDRSYLTSEHKAIIESMALTIKKISKDQLITVHTQGGRSVAQMFDNPDWMDFISWQTGHMGEAYPSWYPIERDINYYNKPVLDIEPCYEAHPIMNEFVFTRRDLVSRFTAKHVRRTSYWSVFAGGCGITYGCYSLWQMRRPEDDGVDIPESAAVAYKQDTIPYWYDALDYPGSLQICILKKLLESFEDWDKRVVANELLISENNADETHVRAMRHSEGKWITLYCPTQKKIMLDISQFGTRGFIIEWFHPEYGIRTLVSDSITESLILNITPPTNTDWVLILREKNEYN